MADVSYYRYPFDKDGQPVLNFGEAVAAARILEAQLSKLMDRWTWPELWLRIVERRPGCVRYEVHRNGRFVGFATVMPNSVAPPQHDLQSVVEEKTTTDEARRDKAKRA
jgi:hypothetical protein